MATTATPADLRLLSGTNSRSIDVSTPAATRQRDIIRLLDQFRTIRTESDKFDEGPPGYEASVVSIKRGLLQLLTLADGDPASEPGSDAAKTLEDLVADIRAEIDEIKDQNTAVGAAAARVLATPDPDPPVPSPQ